MSVLIHLADPKITKSCKTIQFSSENSDRYQRDWGSAEWIIDDTRFFSSSFCWYRSGFKHSGNPGIHTKSSGHKYESTEAVWNQSF